MFMDVCEYEFQKHEFICVWIWIPKSDEKLESSDKPWDTDITNDSQCQSFF